MSLRHYIALLVRLIFKSSSIPKGYTSYYVGNKTKEAPSEEDPDEMSDLYEEATMSIEELITRYGKRIRENVEESEGNSKALAMDMISKMCAKGRKSKKISEVLATDSEPTEKSEENKDSGEDKLVSEKESLDKPVTVDETRTNSGVESENKVPEVKNESNGKIHNGSDNHETDHSKPNEAPVSVKGKGVGKGLSNSIRKVVEKTPEEIEMERREAEKMAKRQERKKSLRSKSADELYK